MKKTLVGLGITALLVPAAAFALFDCGATECSEASLIQISSDVNSSTEHRIQALQMLVVKLTQMLQTIIAHKKQPAPGAPVWDLEGGGKGGGPTCFVPTYDLYIGRTDAQTNGEVSKLQQFLLDSGYGNTGGDSGPVLQNVTGYYGNLTAAAVVRWQIGHGMNFVTINSGVGKMTRAKMQEACGNAAHPGWKAYAETSFSFSYPPTMTAQTLTSRVPVTGATEWPQYPGVKIIDATAVPNLGKNVCGYGESGLTNMVCSVENEKGIQMLVVDKSAATVAAWVNKDLTTEVSLLGKNVTRYSVGSHGDGVDTYYIPVSESRTLVVSRHYGTSYSIQYPSQALFDQVIETLVLK